MQDFLKDRTVVEPQQARVVIPSPVAPASVAAAEATSFARIVRGEPAIASATVRPASPSAKSHSSATDAHAAHSSQVKTVVENGRITRLVVTCSCGKVTEIACTY